MACNFIGQLQALLVVVSSSQALFCSALDLIFGEAKRLKKETAEEIKVCQKAKVWHGTGTCREVVAVVVALASKDAESSVMDVALHAAAACCECSNSSLACIGKFVSLFLSSSSL